MFFNATYILDMEIFPTPSSLIFAAMDTTSNSLSRTLYILAENQEAQENLRQEFAEAREEYGGENVPFDKLIALPYLDAVCRETLRV
jgi:cytochrome P450